MTATAPTGGGSVIRPRDRDAVIAALRAGVVPRRGQQHIQVGRAGEVAALDATVATVAEGGAAVKFLVGEYGSGKSFLIHLARSIALKRRLITVHADLTPARRLHATGGQARSLYAELTRNMATLASPDGAALSSVVEQFVTSSLQAARSNNSTVDDEIRGRLARLQQLTGGYDFAEAVAAYWQGHDTGNEDLKSAAVQWLRGEFSTRTEAREALGVRTIIDDAGFYDYLKLLAEFVRAAGYTGLLVCLDEMVNIYKMANTQARSGNYEQLLRIINDCLQGAATGIGFVFSITPKMLMDPRRGLYSYEALQSRLAENTFAVAGLTDRSGPLLHLANLTREDMYVLLRRLRHVYASGDSEKYLVPDEALTAFMAHCSNRLGDAYFRTPRNTVKEFLDLLAVLDSNPGADWTQLVAAVEITDEPNPDLVPLTTSPDTGDSDDGSDDDVLADLRL